MTDSAGFTIDMTVPGRRREVALLVLKSRLGMAVHFRKTDSYALHAARQWALKEHPKDRPKEFKTMKQALAWVEAELKKIEEAKNGTQSAGSEELE